MRRLPTTTTSSLLRSSNVLRSHSPSPRLIIPSTTHLQQNRYGSHSSKQKIALIGSGTIGLSFAALHLEKNPTSTVSVFDTRPDLYEYITTHLPNYLVESKTSDSWQDRLTLAPTLQKAVEYADVVQEQGPETLDFKKGLWKEVEQVARSDAMLWSSTSGIPASVQNQDMKDKTRLLVVHPYNPPHIMPLLELVPSPTTSQAAINKSLKYWRGLGRTPVVIKKECTGFVANRLAFALFREASSLVAQGVVDVKDLDAIVTSSMGPRWSISGPFKSYHAGGGEGGLASLLDKIGGTVQACWDTSEEDIKREKIDIGVITILDRIKEMIKVKGIGVAPAELEDLLLGHDKVEDVAVLGIQDDYSGEVPKAYIVPKKGHEAGDALGRELIKYVRDNKERNKKVVEVEFCEEIPKSASGKILRRILRDKEKRKEFGTVVREERASL